MERYNAILSGGRSSKDAMIAPHPADVKIEAAFVRRALMWRIGGKSFRDSVNWAQLARIATSISRILIRDFLEFSDFTPANYLNRQNQVPRHELNIKRNQVSQAQSRLAPDMKSRDQQSVIFARRSHPNLEGPRKVLL